MISLLGEGICHEPAVIGKCVENDGSCAPIESLVCLGEIISRSCGANNVPAYHSIKNNEKCKFNNNPNSSCSTAEKSPCAMRVITKCITRIDAVCEIEVGGVALTQNVYKCEPELQMDTEEPYGLYTDAS